ncbi:MAG: hypothetical protein M3Y38_01650 [Actinomycetota bacterium]|nr:hypothetical protein [Actinomycetota bacterium]
MSVVFAVSVFAPVAAAQGDDGGVDDRGRHARGTDDRGFDDRGMHARGADDRGFDDKGMNNSAEDDNAAASPASSASASASPDASPSASPTASEGTTASATPVLPDTSGFPPAWVLGPLAMILGGGLMALGIVRRR